VLHILRETKETVHWGYFDAALAPALKVKSGDHVHIQAITHHAGDAPDLMLDDAIHCDFQFPTRLIETANEWMVHAFDEDLSVAMRQASLEMLRLLTELKGTSRDDAYSLMSVAADFTVTQVVDGRQGIHARIPRSAFPPRK